MVVIKQLVTCSANEVCSTLSRSEPMSTSHSRDSIASLLMKERENEYIDLKKYRYETEIFVIATNRVSLNNNRNPDNGGYLLL